MGYMVIMAVWSLSAMAHSLANTVLEFGIARFCLGIGESGNFPAAIKTVAEWFPQKRAFAGHRHLQLRNQCRGHPCAHRRALGGSTLWLACGLPYHRGFSASWIVLWFFIYRKPAEHAKLGAAELRYINEGQIEAAVAPATPWIKLLGYRQTWAFALGKFLTDPDLVVLPFLAALVLHHSIPFAAGQSMAPLIRCVQRIDRGQHFRRLAAGALPQYGTLANQLAAGRDALLRLPGRAYSVGQLYTF